MAKAYRCDLCNKFVDDCYSVGGIDIYPRELREMVLKKTEDMKLKKFAKIATIN